MKISTATVRLNLRHTFRIARSADDFRESIVVRITGAGGEGFGEAAPIARYGQTAATAGRALSSLNGTIPGSPEHIDRILNDLGERFAAERAALSAIDIALHDLLGKRLGAPLYAILGLDPERTPVTSYTIGIDSPEIIRRKVEEAADYPVLKVKMGLENDYEIMETIRRLTDRPVRVDANEGWTEEEALEKIRWLEGRNVELIEQPLPADRLDESRRLAERVSIPLFADESVHTAEDIPRLAGAFHGINIKLTKCGGIREAIRMIHTARACKMQVMLGCTIESSIGITAAAQISPLVDFADLDGNVLITNDPAAGVRTVRGKLVLPNAPGLGITVTDRSIRDALGGPPDLT
ncbi:MAG TPA: dipeptide epimerase [Patescibacteria group bacterium]|nr:dipeptide epimerase [Patescibacteria group bacterium]